MLLVSAAGIIVQREAVVRPLVNRLEDDTVRRRARRRSIVAVLIGVAYIATTEILRKQINERLSTVASDRQEMLAYTLQQQQERATQLRQPGSYSPSVRPACQPGRSARTVSGGDRDDSRRRADQHDRLSRSLDRGRQPAGVLASSGPEDLVNGLFAAEKD